MKRIISLFVIISLLLLSVSCAGNDDDRETRSKDSRSRITSDDDSSKAESGKESSKEENSEEPSEEESSEEEPPKEPSEGLEFTSNGNGTCYVSDIGSCTDKDVVIPSVSPDGDKVTGIGNHAFEKCGAITSVTIQNGVKSIGHYAFYKCSSLASITIPNSVTSIGEYAFSSC